MTLHRICLLFLGVLAIASLIATLAGRPESWWILALILGAGSAWYLTGMDPLKGFALALMATRGALIVLAGMFVDSWAEFRARWADRWQASRRETEGWD